MHILIVEDEEHLADGLRFNLEAEGYEATVVFDGEAALKLCVEEKQVFDAIVLDVMLPEIDGFEVAATLRENKIFTPILMLTARSRPQDVLSGFAAGTDDYLPKPFDLNIFLARLSGLLRRREWFKQENTESKVVEIYNVNGKTIDLQNLELRDESQTVALTLMEAKLLRYLIENAEKVVSRKTILEKVWDLSEDTDTRAIDNFIVRLRKYLEKDAANPKHLLTIRGVGYKFVF
ncbi:MAG: response regulator transcription factor [Pyrinomonadaceae bacterium]|nr:response regulator transcription factor [Pyrinomonadaceae bacterium]